MFNPLYLFTVPVLEKTVKRGCHYFVRNRFAPEHGAKPHHFLVTHYDDRAKAMAHYHASQADPYRFFYEWDNEIHRQKLQLAATQPAGYYIYSAYFLPGYKKKITPLLKKKISRFMYQHTDWQPGRGETVNLDFYLQFGALYTTLRYGDQQLKVKFEEIEKQS